MLGLGTGTLALYGHEGDFFRFYEINPDRVNLQEFLWTDDYANLLATLR